MQRGEKIYLSSLETQQSHKRHQSLTSNYLAKHQKRQQIKRANSIHHITNSRKPEINRNKTYIDQSCIKKEDYSYCYSYRKHLSSVQNNSFHDISRQNNKIKSLTNRQDSFNDKNQPMTFRNRKEISQRVMPPQQLRSLIKSLRQGQKQKLTLRLR